MNKIKSPSLRKLLCTLETSPSIEHWMHFHREVDPTMDEHDCLLLRKAYKLLVLRGNGSMGLLNHISEMTKRNEAIFSLFILSPRGKGKRLARELTREQARARCLDEIPRLRQEGKRLMVLRNDSRAVEIYT